MRQRARDLAPDPRLQTPCFKWARSAVHGAASRGNSVNWDAASYARGIDQSPSATFEVPVSGVWAFSWRWESVTSLATAAGYWVHSRLKRHPDGTVLGVGEPSFSPVNPWAQWISLGSVEAEVMAGVLLVVDFNAATADGFVVVNDSTRVYFAGHLVRPI